MSKRFSAPCPVEWEGVTYESYNAAARKLGIPLSTVRYRALKGYKSEADALRGRNWQPCEWNGITYLNTTQAARENWITPPGMRKRVQKGQTSDDQLKGYRGSV